MMEVPKIVTTMRDYGPAALRADLLAGLTVAMVAIPLAIAIAVASGATPAQGLVTAVVAGFLISGLGGSRVQIGGPTGAFIVVVAGIVAAHGMDGLILATLMAGAILIVAGLLRTGRLLVWVPDAVVQGFTMGIAAIIALSQVKDALGLRPLADHADIWHKVPALWEARGTWSPAAVAVTLATMGLIVLLRRLAPRWPGLIVAVAAGSALAAVLPGVETLGDRFGEIPRHLPAPALPAIEPGRLMVLLGPALTIAFLAGIEALLSAMVADRMIRGCHRPDAELVAQGVANIGSAAFGGLPATGAIARTATNVRAGGRTPVAGLAHAGFVLLIMTVAAPLAGRLAMPALAGLLILTAWNMAEPHRWREHLHLPIPEVGLLASTLLLTVLADLTLAIAVGVAGGLALRLLGRPPAPGLRPPARE